MTLERFSLAGKKALVTGASRGIGQVIAANFPSLLTTFHVRFARFIPTELMASCRLR